MEKTFAEENIYRVAPGKTMLKRFINLEIIKKAAALRSIRLTFCTALIEDRISLETNINDKKVLLTYFASAGLQRAF